MNQVDFFIAVVVVACGISGARRGTVAAGGDLAALAVGLIIASLIYPAAAATIRWVLGPPEPLSALVGFVLAAIAVVVGATWGLFTNHSN